MAGVPRKIPMPLKDNLYDIIYDLETRPKIIKEVQKPPQIIEVDLENEPQILDV